MTGRTSGRGLDDRGDRADRPEEDRFPVAGPAYRTAFVVYTARVLLSVGVLALRAAGSPRPHPARAGPTSTTARVTQAPGHVPLPEDRTPPPSSQRPRCLAEVDPHPHRRPRRGHHESPEHQPARQCLPGGHRPLRRRRPKTGQRPAARPDHPQPGTTRPQRHPRHRHPRRIQPGANHRHIRARRPTRPHRCDQRRRRRLPRKTIRDGQTPTNGGSPHQPSPLTGRLHRGLSDGSGQMNTRNTVQP